MTTLNLEGLKPLTTLQFDECKERAIRRVERHLGEKPERDNFVRQLGKIWQALDTLSSIVFVVALIVSSIHIITHVGILAAAAYDALTQATGGIEIPRGWFVALHQILMIPLAEGSLILFLVMFGVSVKPKPVLQPGEKAKFEFNWRRWTYFILAIAALVFVANANLSSGMGWLESVLPPLFTVGIGLKLEHLIVQYMNRDREVTKRYLEALATWEAATADATKHPDYMPYFMNELWSALMKPKGNQWAIEAPPGFKLAAVRRELSRENWTHSDIAPVAEFVAENPIEEVRPVREVKPKQVAIPFGEGGGLMPDENDSISPMPSANGHTAVASLAAEN